MIIPGFRFTPSRLLLLRLSMATCSGWRWASCALGSWLKERYLVIVSPSSVSSSRPWSRAASSRDSTPDYAYNTFPLMQAQWIPEGLWRMQPFYRNLFENLITVQFMHRVLALVSLLSVGLLWLAARRSALWAGARRACHWLLGAAALQITLGISTVIFSRRAATPGLGSSGGSARAPDDRHMDVARDARSPAQISICVPSSITRFVGILKKSIALAALRDIVMKSFSRQRAMPGLTVGIMVSRLRKNEVSS